MNLDQSELPTPKVNFFNATPVGDIVDLNHDRFDLTRPMRIVKRDAGLGFTYTVFGVEYPDFLLGRGRTYAEALSDLRKVLIENYENPNLPVVTETNGIKFREYLDGLLKPMQITSLSRI